MVDLFAPINPENRLYLEDQDTLQIHVIGYKYQGESIIINIGDKFVGVIDCYRTKKYFATKEFLEKRQVKELNFICWTHTDLDHTRGLSELFDYVTDQTVLIMPTGISLKEILSSAQLETNKEYVKIFSLIREKIKEYNYYPASNSSTILNFEFIIAGKIYNFIMQSFAPLGAITQKNSLKTYTDILKHNRRKDVPNYFSVGLYITITDNTPAPDWSICLTGDMDNYTFKRMNPVIMSRIFENMTLLKVPHHGSKSADQLTKHILKFDYAAVTSYRIGRSKLPNADIIDQYKSFGEVARTSFGLPKEGRYGIITYNFDLIRRKIDVEYTGAANLA